MKTWLHTHLPRLQSGDTLDVISVKIPGKRVEYASWVSMKDVEFKVHEHGRRRCITQGVRNVHAWVVGTEVLRLSTGDLPEVWGEGKPGPSTPVGYRRAVYDPWKGGTFIDSETLEPVLTADLVIMSGKNVYYANLGD